MKIAEMKINVFQSIAILIAIKFAVVVCIYSSIHVKAPRLRGSSLFDLSEFVHPRHVYHTVIGRPSWGERILPASLAQPYATVANHVIDGE